MKEFIQKHKLFSFYTALMLVIVFIAIFAPWLAPGDAFTSDMSKALQAPSAQHWFGTDKLGRDVLSRIIYGTQLSLFMGVSIVVIMVSIGTVIGAVAGYFGGKVEMVLMRLADIMLSFPGVVLAIAIAGILGGSIVNTILALSVVGWAKYARLVRSMTLKVRGEEYVTAAVMMGASTWTILRRHIIPNILLAPGDAFTSDMSKALQAPSAQHWFGTDKLGRDVLSRIIYGTQLSLFMGVSIVVIMVSIGTVIGAVAGYFGGKVEMVLMRLADIMLSFPGVVLAIAIAGILGGSIVNTILALSVVGWAKYARLVRSMTLKVRGEEYVTAAVMMGASTWTILRRHIIPNILPLVVTTGALDIGAIMIEVPGLSFLGFGAQPPTPEWGLMLNEGRQYLQTSPWLMAFPGMSILIVVAVFNLWSDSLRDVVDPKNQG